jgi:hypothetical protein
MASIFETIGMEDPLMLWTPAVSMAGSALGAVSFSEGGDQAAPEAAGPVYRVNLPADGASASQALTGSESYLTSLSAALENIPARLDGLVARTQQKAAVAGGVSFDALSPDQLESGPEAELLSLLGQAEAEAKIASFGVQESVGAALEQAKVGFDAFIQQFDRDVLHFAWVETNVADALVARTIVSWTGAAQTAFAYGLGDPQVALHGRALRIVSQTRGLRLRLSITIVSGAAKVSALMATPAGRAFALPAVYQYVMQIVAQVKQLQSIQTP